MAGFTRVEVHFQDANNVSRMIVVVPSKDEKKQVKAIFLHDSAKDHLKGFNSVPKGPIETAPIGSLGGDVEAATSTRNAGPSDVCYLIGGSLHCWLP